MVGMKISLVTPAGKQSRSGNRATAVRWAGILEDLGHRVTVSEPKSKSASAWKSTDVMVAVHAWRSAGAIRSFSEAFPDRPLVTLLAGTDIYKYQHSHPDETLGSMDRATALVCLHDLVGNAIPERYGEKLRVIHQSASPLSGPRKPSPRWFEVCVAGHLRDEKDSLRAAYAARLAPPESKLRVIHLGKAYNAQWSRDAKAEAKSNPRYIWRGEVSAGQVRRQFARSHAMVITSVMEGGANIVSEAIVAGLPVIASGIDGNVGLLGEDYDGYFPAEDSKLLAAALQLAEEEPKFLKRLQAQCKKRQALFKPAKEKTAWRKLLKDLSG